MVHCVVCDIQDVPNIVKVFRCQSLSLTGDLLTYLPEYSLSPGFLA